MSLNIKDKILQVSSEKYRYCLLKVDFNHFDVQKYFAKEQNYLSYEIVGFSAKKKSINENLDIKVNKEELLEVCGLFADKFMSGEKVWFQCVRIHEYNKKDISSYKKCKEVDMSLMDFSVWMNHVLDCSQTQHFQFSLASKKSELCGFVHGFEGLSEFTENLALNLGDSKVKLKIKL